MSRFVDKEAGPWLIDLTIGTVVRVKSASGGRFDLFEPSGPFGTGEKPRELQHVLWDDLGTFWELLWLIIEPQATARQTPVSAEEFGQLMAADCLVDAQAKFFLEWRDFFQKLQRPEKAAALEKLGQYTAKALDLIRAQLADPRLATIDQKVETQMKSVLSKSFGSLLDSLDSIPADTPGGNSTG